MSKIVEIGDPAPDAEIFDAPGKQHSLAAKCAEGPTVLIFLRHWG